MRNTTILFIVVIELLIALGTGCSSGPQKASIDPAKLRLFSTAPDSVPPKGGELTVEKVALGRMLYYDTRLSKSQKISCNSCHDLARYGVDGNPVSTGHKGQKGDRNSPTVYNAAGHFVQFWDGRARDVEEQAKGPMMNPVEMAMASDKVVVATLKSMPEYVAAFKKAFPTDKDPVTFDNVGNAIGAFERKLVTSSRWDKFLKGDEALTAEEKAGLATFINTGCITCHAGTYLGGNMFQKVGAVKPWPDATDPGRFTVTKNEVDRMMFKVPSLRNIEKTGPYFHDGKTATLAEAITKMGVYQIGKTLTDTEVKSIETFLKALTGEIPADYIKQPVLPKSTPKTPKASEAD